MNHKQASVIVGGYYTAMRVVVALGRGAHHTARNASALAQHYVALATTSHKRVGHDAAHWLTPATRSTAAQEAEHEERQQDTKHRKPKNGGVGTVIMVEQ